MEYLKDKKEIILNRELSELDKFVLKFCSILNKYVLVSGYVSILFGRSRATEDVDLLIPPLNKEDFYRTWKKLYEKDFWCINTPVFEDAFEMLKEHAIRFSRKNKPVPNIEFKFIKNEIDRLSYNNKIRVIINSGSLFISPLELQIAYKLFLGSEKDLEDARHIYNLFKEKLDKQELIYSLKKLNVKEKMRFLKDGKHQGY